MRGPTLFHYVDKCADRVRLVIFALVILLCLLFQLLLTRAAHSCELAIILAIDASSSVNEQEYQLQQKGLAAAISSPEVMQAILANNGVEAMAYEWSGRYNQTIMADWTRLDSETAIAAFALRIAAHQRTRNNMPTAMGYALGFGSNQFRRSSSVCNRKVIDVAGDGVQNEGFGPYFAYRNFDFSGIVVNGLVIKGDDPDPEEFYRREVLHGPGAFLVIAQDFHDYRRAMQEKLLKEAGMRSLSRLRIDEVSQ